MSHRPGLPCQAYLSEGAFTTGHMMKFLEEYVAGAAAEGNVVRITGEGAWAFEGPPCTDELLDYESELNRFIGRYPQMILCLYDLSQVGGAILVDLIKTHHKLILGGMMLDNPYYLTPDEFRAARQN
jgi:hypothetical protein